MYIPEIPDNELKSQLEELVYIARKVEDDVDFCSTVITDSATETRSTALAVRHYRYAQIFLLTELLKVRVQTIFRSAITPLLSVISEAEAM